MNKEVCGYIFLALHYFSFLVRQLLDTSHYLADIPMRDATRVLVMLNQSRMWQLDRKYDLVDLPYSAVGKGVIDRLQ